MRLENAFSLVGHLPHGFGKFDSPVRPSAANTAINTEATPAEAAAKTNRMNTYGYLRTEFFDPKNRQGNIMLVSSLPSGARAVLVDPSAPYMPGSKMVVATHPDLFIHANQGEKARDYELIVPEDTIYGLPKDAQTEYWRMIIQSLRGLQKFTDNNPNPELVRVFASENCMPRTSAHTRTSRSINLPHAQLHRADTSLITPYSKNDMAKLPDYFKEEKLLQTVSKSLADVAYENLDDRTKAKLVDISDEHPTNTKLRQRTDRPYGYTFTVDRSVSIEEFTGVMRDLHRTYREAAKHILSGAIDFDQDNAISQPAYKLLLYLEQNGAISGIISPAVFAPTGVLETAGVKLNRHVDNPNPVSQTKLDEIRTEVAKAVYKVNLMK
jgi:hypothetical protein